MKPVVIIAVGLPGAGKSHYFELLGAHAVSSDAIRLQLADDETDQTIHGAVFATMRYLIRQRIELQRPVTYVDATNLTRRDRKPFIKLAREYGCPIEALYFDVPLEICKVRNARRARVVPAHALDLMAAKLIPPSIEEGFTRVTIAADLPEKPPEPSAG